MRTYSTCVTLGPPAVFFLLVGLVSTSSWGFFDVNTFSPASTYEDGFQLEYGRVLPSMAPGFGAIIQIEDDPLVERQVDPTTDSKAPVVERLMAFHLAAALGLFDYAQIGFQVPLYMDTGQGTDSAGGVGDVRLIPKGAYRFRIKGHELGVALLLPLSLPSGADDAYVGEGVVGFAPRLAVDTTFFKIRVALNWGFFLRSQAEMNGVSRGSEMHFGLGASMPIDVKSGLFDLMLEVVGNTQLHNAFSRDTAPFDVLGGIRYRFESGIALNAGVGFGVSPSIGAPDLRVVFGVGWVGSSFISGKRDMGGGLIISDRDLDGIPDEKDLCLDASEDFDQWEDEDGCPEEDNDEDGFDDLEDKCPNEAETFDGVEDDDGCPDADVDGDTVPEYRDKCKGEKEDLDGFQDLDGCPDTDNDGDTILDVADSCPNLPEIINQIKDEDGCPDFFKIENNVIVFPKQLRFVWRLPDVELEDFAMLEEVLASMQVHPEWTKLRIEVHAFGGGKDDDQLQLTQGRADQVLRFFEASGVEVGRMEGVGMGNKRVLAPPTTPQNKKMNQRTEIHIVEIAK